MSEKKDVKPHIYLGSTGKPEPFTSPSTGGGAKPDIPPRNRQQHGSELIGQLRTVEQQQAGLRQEADQYELESVIGIQVEFESFPGIELAVESLADARQKIELLNVIPRDNKIFATIFVPEGKLSSIEAKLRAYLEEKRDAAGRPRDNRKLIDAIQSFRTAALEALWTDDRDQLPDNPEETFWWEVWLPVRRDRNAVLHDFQRLAKAAKITVSEQVLEFPERSVLLAKGNRHQFSRSGLLLNSISELRRAKETAAFFDELSPEEQQEWAADLRGRLVQPLDAELAPYVCLLDTGTNIGHPLLEPFNDSADQLTIDADWTGADDHGHGTGMAGLAAWGDLTQPLEDMAAVEIKHRLESVKVLRYPHDNEGKHLGVVTADGVATPEIQNPLRTRVFSMALSATDTRDRGRPSAWSAALDSLAVDYLGENQTPRLFTISAGNSGDDLMAMAGYPDYNLLRDIHDPGQAWNALTVGGYTEKDNIVESDCVAYTPLAPAGGLSPFSTTSVTWHNSTPIKPEVVFEAGNVGKDTISCASIPSLSLLTTHHQPVQRLFSTFHATSAATALASRFAANIYAQYPTLWPETVRALMVHSAEWTGTMVAQFSQGTTDRQRAQHRVRSVGYGVPYLERALWSANNSLALIVEDKLQPFGKFDGKIKTRDMHLHDLPWPKDALQDLGETAVEMTVTLSYFIEPNPSSRIVSGKYSYQSHGLRFDVKRQLESVYDFRKRINRQARDEEEGTTKAPADPDWLLGSQFRHKGSIHKDVWKGKAVDLAERGQIAVYPAMGWWRTRAGLGRYDKEARYALVVTISVPDVDVDIYSAISALVTAEQILVEGV
ncbi:S8 family peptidase [Thiohalophilus sp.]|uniref:S8 family peptidase n=1 Tax=Thiohalophilus sp. TaxID=3028392 RepID=UPI002ACE63AF|nr:S8 family peptidase [Thiohalophilus sp.]MDZ7663004.1 S8 family peptidase [Thiohalophilus sp.]